MKRLKIKLLTTRTARRKVFQAFVAADNGGPVPVKIESAEGGTIYTNPHGVESFVSNEALSKARVAVRKGAKLLDKYVPGWEEKIQLDLLDIAHCDICVCGQIAQAADIKFLPPKKQRESREYGADWSLVWDSIVDAEGFSRNYTPRAIACGFLSNESFTDAEGSTYPALEIEWHRFIVARRNRAAKRAAA